jgi:hypothetical protein
MHLRTRTRLSLVVVLSLLLTLTLTGVGRADVTLGSTTPPAGADISYCSGSKFAQLASDPSTPYTVPSAGTITSWRVNANLAAIGAPVTMFVLRPAGASYTVVGTDTGVIPNPIPPIASFTVASPIAVNPGDILGIYGQFSNVLCYFGEGTTPLADSVGAMSPAGAPATGQTLAVADSGSGFVLNLSATLTTPAPPHKKKKCKKKKKRAAAQVAKKKKCKKKKRSARSAHAGSPWRAAPDSLSGQRVRLGPLGARSNGSRHQAFTLRAR